MLRANVQRDEPLIKVISKGKHSKTQAEQTNPSAFQLTPARVTSIAHSYGQNNSTTCLVGWTKPKHSALPLLNAGKLLPPGIPLRVSKLSTKQIFTLGFPATSHVFSRFHLNLLHCPASPWNPCSKLPLPAPGLAQVEEYPSHVTALTVNPLEKHSTQPALPWADQNFSML